MQRVVVLLFCLTFLLLSACAVIDTSNLDTAHNIGAGENVLCQTLAQGVDMNSTVLYSQYELDEDKKLEAGTDFLAGLRFTHGITNSTDLQLSLAFPISFLVKAAIKQSLSQADDPIQIALKPAIYYAAGTKPWSTVFPDKSSPFKNNYRCSGAELTLLLSHDINEVFSVTVAPKLIYSQLDYERIDMSVSTVSVVESGRYKSFYPGSGTHSCIWYAKHSDHA